MRNNLSSELSDKYTRFRTHLRRSWINVKLHSQIRDLLREKCKDPHYADSVIVDCLSPVGSERQANIRLRGKSLLGFIESSKGAGTEWALEWTLTSSIALFEAFVSDSASAAYLSDPERFILGRIHQDSTEKENHNVTEILIKSNTKEEALEKIAEEKLRNIFYGNPIDAFIRYQKNGAYKDGKLRFGLNEVLHDNCARELKLYAEMVGRRNSIVHNAGIIDSKYVREIEGMPEKLSIGSKVQINEAYLFSSLRALDKIATYYIQQVSRTCGISAAPKNAKL
ncbi:hypothetical protein [Candidatus Venteria ishoeyi]|uniref:RiboL-PSP-HEPN domain-containing protein n=1 Tax=Candidatus Venteria ishoeyi TaxID=1899563 RepID=A0A1H6FCQ4_9GAMM|nr:hypothetical protein [Candidatus Venteria ishoeyi]SEH07109.1 Uncharacterised protein [Candidatus Venteria ishoeyi]